MRKIISYIAMSLDGKIARTTGDVKWLDEIPNPDKLDYGYNDFYKSIGTTLMGRTTYEHVKEYGFDYYKDTKNYVFSSRQAEPQEHLEFVSQDVVSFVKKLRQQPGKAIWLIGGGKLNTAMLKAKMIDEMLLFIMPVVLGEGISLFEDEELMHEAQLLETETYKGGVIRLHYKF